MRISIWSASLTAVSVFMLSGSTRANEKEAPLKELPEAVTKAVEKMYPKAEMLDASSVVEELEFYEVQLKSADGKEDDDKEDGK